MVPRRVVPLILLAVAVAVILAASSVQRSGTLFGVVLNAEGQPVPGRTVHLVSVEDPETPVRSTKSEVGGHYLFEGVAPGPWITGAEVNAAERALQGPGLLIGAVESTVEKGLEVRQDIRLVPALPLAGVVDPARPAAGWSVAAFEPSGERVAEGTTGEDGRFLLRTTYQGEVWLAAFRASRGTVDPSWELHARSTATVPVGLGTEAVLEVGPNLLALRSPPGIPDPDPYVGWTLVPAEERPGDFWWEYFRKQRRAASSNVRSGTTKEVRGLMPGPYRIKVEREGQEAWADLTIPADGTLEYDLEPLHSQVMAALAARPK